MSSRSRFAARKRRTRWFARSMARVTLRSPFIPYGILPYGKIHIHGAESDIGRPWWSRRFRVAPAGTVRRSGEGRRREDYDHVHERSDPTPATRGHDRIAASGHRAH